MKHFFLTLFTLTVYPISLTAKESRTSFSKVSLVITNLLTKERKSLQGVSKTLLSPNRSRMESESMIPQFQGTGLNKEKVVNQKDQKTGKWKQTKTLPGGKNLSYPIEISFKNDKIQFVKTSYALPNQIKVSTQGERTSNKKFSMKTLYFQAKSKKPFMTINTEMLEVSKKDYELLKGKLKK